jgi:hypothetical protein
MKRTIKFYFEVVVEASDETLVVYSNTIKNNPLGWGEQLNSVFYFYPNAKLLGGTLNNAKPYTNKIISHRMPKCEEISYDETTNSTIIRIFEEHRPNAKDEDKDNEEN